MASKLTALPQELLDLLLTHLSNIEDLVSLSSTCRTFRATCSKAPPNLTLRLAAAQSSTFFRPHPHFLIAATANQLPSQVFNGSLSVSALRSALQGGIEGLYDLCIERCGITLPEIRELHDLRFSLINPLTDWIDKLAGQQWYSTPDFWDGGVSDAGTITTEPERALFQFAIYAELFGSSVENYLRSGGKSSHVLDREVRLDYVKYCIPDWVCAGGYSGLVVLDTGPYTKGRAGVDVADQMAMHHILGCRGWNEAWADVWVAVGEGWEGRYTPGRTGMARFESYRTWRQRVWGAAVMLQGLRGLKMLRPGGLTEAWKEKLGELRELVHQLEDSAKPTSIQVPVRRAWDTLDFPLLEDEVLVCVQPMWRGGGRW